MFNEGVCCLKQRLILLLSGYKSFMCDNGIPMQCLGVGEVTPGKLVKLCLLSSANKLTGVLDTLYITAHFLSSGAALPSAFSISKMILLKTSTAVSFSLAEDSMKAAPQESASFFPSSGLITLSM